MMTEVPPQGGRGGKSRASRHRTFFAGCMHIAPPLEPLYCHIFYTAVQLYKSFCQTLVMTRGLSRYASSVLLSLSIYHPKTAVPRVPLYGPAGLAHIDLTCWIETTGVENSEAKKGRWEGGGRGVGSHKVSLPPTSSHRKFFDTYSI